MDQSKQNQDDPQGASGALSVEAAKELFHALRQFQVREIYITARDLYDDGSLPVLHRWGNLSEMELMLEVLHELALRLSVDQFALLAAKGQNFDQLLHNYQKDILSGACDLMEQACAVAEFMAVMMAYFGVEELVVEPFRRAS